jgi:CheY-like chemotaxis protein
MSTVWVVEDNDLNFELVEYLLGEVGWSIARARDAAEFDVLLAHEPPRLVLLDMNLPEISGLELLAQLRASPRHAAVPVVALTAHAMQGDRQRFLDAGCDAYVPKPIDRRQLFAEIAAVLERAGT